MPLQHKKHVRFGTVVSLFTLITSSAQLTHFSSFFCNKTLFETLKTNS